MRDAPTQRKPKNRRATFRFPMPSVRASIPSAVANGSSNPKIQRQRQSILATRSSVMFDRRLACWESRSAAGTTSGTRGTTLRKHGWSAKVRADILGHSSLQVTDGVYDHSDQADFREAL